MKTSSKSLFFLIQALSKEEKRYVLRTAIHYRKGGKNILMQLFKAMEHMPQENYDEKKLGQKIPNLSVRKNELYETILTSLANRETENQAIVMLGKLRWAGMLHYRKLFPEALSVLSEVEDWAREQNQLYIEGVILQYKAFFANTGLYKNHNINFSGIGDSMVRNAQKILHITEIYRQYVEVAKITRISFLLRSAEEVQRVNDLLQSPVYEKDLSDLPVSSRCFMHLSRYYLYKLKGEYEQAFSAAENCWKLMQDGTVNFSKRRPQEYLIGFVAYLAACLDSKRLDECKKWLPEMRKLWLNNYHGHAVVGGKYYSLWLACHYLDAKKHYMVAVTDEVMQFHAKHEAILEEGGEGRGLKYLLMLSYFQQKDLINAWDYCRMILNSSATASRRELYDCTRLVFLFILFESGKFDELEYQCRQLTGFIRKKNRKEYLLERILLKHLTGIHGKANLRKERRTMMINLSKDLQSLSIGENHCAKQLLHCFDFINYAREKAKISPAMR